MRTVNRQPRIADQWLGLKPHITKCKIPGQYGLESAAGDLYWSDALKKRSRDNSGWLERDQLDAVECFEFPGEAVHKEGKGVSAPVPEYTHKDVIRRQNGHFYMLADSIGITLERAEDPWYSIRFGSSSCMCINVGNVAELTDFIDVNSTLSLPLTIRDINAYSSLVNSRIKDANHGSGKVPGIGTIGLVIGPELRQRHPEPVLLFRLYIG